MFRTSSGANVCCIGNGTLPPQHRMHLHGLFLCMDARVLCIMVCDSVSSVVGCPLPSDF